MIVLQVMSWPSPNELYSTLKHFQQLRMMAGTAGLAGRLLPNVVVLPAYPTIPILRCLVIHLLQLPDRLVIIIFAYQELPALGNRIIAFKSNTVVASGCMSVTLFLEALLFFSFSGFTFKRDLCPKLVTLAGSKSTLADPDKC